MLFFKKICTSPSLKDMASSNHLQVVTNIAKSLSEAKQTKDEIITDNGTAMSILPQIVLKVSVNPYIKSPYCAKCCICHQSGGRVGVEPLAEMAANPWMAYRNNNMWVTFYLLKDVAS